MIGYNKMQTAGWMGVGVVNINEMHAWGFGETNREKIK
jgi:hypothetical protein